MTTELVFFNSLKYEEKGVEFRSRDPRWGNKLTCLFDSIAAVFL